LNENRVKKQYAPQIEKEAKYFEELKKQEGVKTLENGVCYKELAAGNGEVLGTGKTVKVEYEGRLLDGTVFDAGTLDAVPVGAGRVIPGFDAALAAMSAGAEWEVTIPAELAYGEQAMDKIPAMSTLVFKLKVVEVVNQSK
jgi:FKBP-type peptidyl-prolyl cis-trans isomerase FklB